MGINELKFSTKEMDAQLLETIKIDDNTSSVTIQLKSIQEELLNKEAEVVAAEDANLEASKQAHLVKTASEMEKETTEELQQQVLRLQLAAIEAEKEKNAALLENQAELKFLTSSLMEALETIKNHQPDPDLIQNLEKELVKKTLLIDSLRMELQQANDQHSSAEKAKSEAVNDINHLIDDMELLVKENSDKDNHMHFLEMELNQLKLEHKIANKDIETLTFKFASIKNELDEITAIQTEAEVEIALLKSELHKKTTAAEAGEERAKLEDTATQVKIQKLESEAEEANNEIKRLLEETDNMANQTGGLTDKECTILVEKANKEDQIQQTIDADNYKLEILKKELEITRTRMGELRTRAEQAAFRAEAAEKGKAEIEEHIRKLREQKEKRKIAYRARKQESSRAITTYKQSLDQPPKTLQPLGKILNMKF